MSTSTLSSRLDAAWGDPQTWIANGLQWTHLEEIRSLINRRISGDPEAGSLEWFARYLDAEGALPLRRALVLGCGTGRVERELHQRGWAREIVAFDLSPQALQSARQQAAGMPGIHYVQASMDELPVGQPPFIEGSFDAVFGIASVHHCSRLEQLYVAVARLLEPGGWFFLDEYVGPDRFQFSPVQMERISALAALLPDRLLTTRSGVVKRGFRAPTVEEVTAVDPSEAACSSRILPLLGEFFDVVAQRPYGGSLLQILLADIAQNFQPADAKCWLQAVIDADDDFERQHSEPPHFSCAIARLKPDPLQAAGPAAARSVRRRVAPKSSGS